ncbi:MAG TPA: FlgD immunoglobulin-like domain containing protein, partial [bacterium]|nr:FlgD immunoglobulin-like domain containing protein [bacterium]
LPKPLAADQSLTIDQLYTPGGKPGSRLLTIRIDGDNTINELSESNNTLTTRVQVVADTLKPEIAVTFDGRTLAAGDWVAAQPVILARLIDDSPLALSDTLRVNLLLDGERVPFSTPMLQLLPPPDTTAAALLKFMPQLHDGEHRLEILFADGSGNLAATAVEFGVAATIRLERVMNYPNPLRESTDFTFELTQAAEVRIRIYTVNGRLIRTLEGGTLGAGFNRLFWDGRDGDGDLLANGVYLYRVDAVSGSERTQVLEKCIVMR